MPLVITVISSERVRSGEWADGERSFGLAHEILAARQRFRSAGAHETRHHLGGEFDDELA